MTQQEMAAAIGVSATAWQNYERGINTPGGEALQKLYELGFSVDRLFAGEAPTHIERTARELDENMLQAVVEVVESLLRQRDLDLPADKKSRLIAMLYLMSVESEPADGRVDNGIAARLLNLIV